MTVDRKINALRDEFDWVNLPSGPVVDVGGAEGSVSIELAEVSALVNFSLTGRCFSIQNLVLSANQNSASQT